MQPRYTLPLAPPVSPSQGILTDCRVQLSLALLAFAALTISQPTISVDRLDARAQLPLLVAPPSTSMSNVRAGLGIQPLKRSRLSMLAQRVRDSVPASEWDKVPSNSAEVLDEVLKRS